MLLQVNKSCRGQTKPCRGKTFSRTNVFDWTYSITETLLQIFATLSVTTATGERSFSALNLIKTYLRTSMQENRLNALALLYINNDIKLDYSQVIDQLAKENRRLNLK